MQKSATKGFSTPKEDQKGTRSARKEPRSAGTDSSSKDVQEGRSSSKKETPKQSVDRKKQSNSKAVPEFSTTVQSGPIRSFIPKSADKDAITRESIRSGGKPRTARDEGKMSSQSDHIVYRSTKGVMEEAKEDEENRYGHSQLRRDLLEILEDKDTRVTITVRKQSESRQSSRKSSRKATPNRLSSEKKRSQRKSTSRDNLRETVEGLFEKELSEVKVEDTLNRQGPMEEEQDEVLNNEEEKKVERKGYSVYEDWRIMEAMDYQLENEGITALSSRALWNEIVDPVTGERLLENERSSESMRDRYKRYISKLDDVAKKEIREFAETHSPEDMKKHYCIFQTPSEGGPKRFMGISAEVNYNTERLKRKTPYGSKPKKKNQSGKKDSEKSKRRQEKSIEEEETDLQQNMTIEEILDQENIFDEDIYEILHEGQDIQPKPTKLNAVNKSLMSVSAMRKEVPEGTTSRTYYKRQGPEEAYISIKETRNTKKRRAAEYEGIFNPDEKELKKVKLNDDYDEDSLQPSDIFRGRKPFNKRKSVPEDFMIYVDIKKGFRQFVQQEIEEEEEEEKNPDVTRLAKLSDKYDISINEIALLFKKVSKDFGDLEEYLRRRDPHLLWEPDQDRDLLENDQKAIKYLKALKGDERVHKRREYLLNLFQ